MAEEFDGPVVVNGLLELKSMNLDPGTLKVPIIELADGGSLSDGNGKGRIEVNEISCTHLVADGDKATGAPAANFRSHVGIDGNAEVTDRLTAGAIGVQNDIEVHGHLIAHGDKAIKGAPAANFLSHVGVEGNVDVSGGLIVEKVIGARENVEIAGRLVANGNIATGQPAANFRSHVGVEGNIECAGRLVVNGNIATGRPAANFRSHVGVEGNIDVGGDVRLLGADCAEDFDVKAPYEADPGSVMVLSADGNLALSSTAYDHRAVGVVSGAGSYRPGLILDSTDRSGTRVPIGLMGKVYCKVDATTEPIEIGDLLTSAHTPGHAMKATDPFKAFGSVVGKALASLSEGRGLIPILVTLQ